MKHPRRLQFLRYNVAACLLLLAGCIPGTRWQGTGGITGVVTDSLCNPIPGATLRVWGTSPVRVGITRANGSFMIKGLPPGSYTLDFTAAGYRKDSISRVDVSDNSDTGIEKIVVRANAPMADPAIYYVVPQTRHIIPTGTIQADVTDTKGKPIHDVTVETNRNWAYNFPYNIYRPLLVQRVAVGTYDLRISHPCYQPMFVKDVVVAKDSTSRISLRLLRRTDVVYGTMGTIRRARYNADGTCACR